MSTYPFLSDDWIAEARRIREEYDSGAHRPPPGEDEPRHHRGALRRRGRSTPISTPPKGSVRLDLGHLDPADLKVTVDYITAKSILVEGNPQAGMQAFMAGKIKVEGDMAKLMALQTVPPDAGAQEIAQRLRDITE